MLRSLLENITLTAAHERFEESARAARERYEKMAGTAYTDDPAYEERMRLFVEWFAFTQPVDDTGETILDVYRREMARGSDAELAMIDALKESVWDILLIKSSGNGRIKTTALYLNKNLVIEDEERAALFSKGELYEARLVQYENKWYMTSGVCHHPSKAVKFIKAEMKMLRKNGDHEAVADFIIRLEAMSVQWQRSRQIKVEDIYKTT